MDVWSHLALGFGVALAPANLLLVLAGCLLGTLIGVLPGIGPVAAIAMLLPATTGLAPVSALILLAAVYYGAQHGGAITAILVHVPGAPSPVRSRYDGYPMACQGRVGPALAAAGWASFFAGCVATLLLVLLAPALALLADQFGPTEYFSLLVLALMGAAVLAAGSLLKALAMVVLGLLLGLVGTDANSGVVRFAFDIVELRDGIGVMALAMGVFGYGGIINQLARPAHAREVFAARVRGLWPTKQDLRDTTPAALRGTAVGSLLGGIPGGSTLLASFAAYALETKVKAKPGEVPLGTGNIRGVAAPEAAHSAAAHTAFLPLLAVGIPTNAVMALMVGAMTLHKIQPGVQVMSSSPELFWGLIASLWLGNLLLVVLNLPLMALWSRLLAVPYRWLFPAIVLFSAVGIFGSTHSSLHIWLVGAFGLVGYVFHKLGMEPAPLLLGFVLAPMMEGSLRGALLLSHGDWSVFVMRPLSAGLLAGAMCMVFLVLMPALQSRRA